MHAAQLSLSDIVVTERRVYQAPMKGARLRFSRRLAMGDWAHMPVRAWLEERCQCERAEPDVGSDGTCPGHAAKEDDRRGVFDVWVRRGMKRRLVKLLDGGWRPAADVTAGLSAAREAA